MTKHRYPWQNPDGTFKDQSEVANEKTEEQIRLEKLISYGQIMKEQLSNQEDYEGTFKNNVELFHGSYSPQKHKALEALRGADEKIEMDKIQELENEQFDSLVDDLRKAEKEIEFLKNGFSKKSEQESLLIHKNFKLEEEIDEYKSTHELEVSNLKEDLSNSKISRNVLTAGIIILTIIQLFF